MPAIAAARIQSKGKRMNKQELVQAVLDDGKSGIESKAAAERAVNAVLESIETGIKKDGVVQLIGFGTFTVKTRAARKGRNPSTGAEIKIKASKTVGFKAGVALKETAKKAKTK
jgi:DNA-binding protein HU-beta